MPKRRVNQDIQSNSPRLLLIAIGFAIVVVAAPIVGWPKLVRLPAVLVPALAGAILIVRPWQWSGSQLKTLRLWQPSPRVIWATALLIGLMLYWLVFTRFRSGEINAIDFTIYFDRPLFQTLRGRPLFVEAADYGFGQRSQLTVHAFWGMLPLALFYAIHPTPQWLLVLSVVSVVFGAVHVLRIVQRLGAGGVLAAASALAFVLNNNTARTLNYGFHPEVLYAWFIPWLLDAGLRGDRISFLAATLASVSVKEDACMPLFAASIALGFVLWHKMSSFDRALFLIVPNVIGLVNLGIYFGYVVPQLTTDGRPTYSNFWANYGATPMLALAGMVSQPVRVLFDTLRSGFFRSVIVPHLFLPIIGWRWMIGIVPIVALYGTSANPQLRAFGVYYAIVLVPFLVIAASFGALTLARSFTKDLGRARWVASSIVLCGALVVGSWNAGYSLRPWRAEITAVPEALGLLADERLVLVQSGLYPHAGYEERNKLLTPETLHEASSVGAAVLLAPAVSAYPLRLDELDTLIRRPRIRPMPKGLVAVRLPGDRER
jgi:uncharacterized membrane protein